MKHNKGDIVRLVHYVKVDSVKQGGNTIECTDLERGFDFAAKGQELVESMDSADQFIKTEKVTKTKLAELLAGVRDNVFTVKFKKQNGTLRTLRGVMVTVETGMGRSNVVDLDLPKKSGAYDQRLRQVDHRTIQELIVGGTRYQLKK